MPPEPTVRMREHEYDAIERPILLKEMLQVLSACRVLQRSVVVHKEHAGVDGVETQQRWIEAIAIALPRRSGFPPVPSAGIEVR